METLKEYLINVYEKKKYRTCAIANNLLNIYNYNNITITSTIIFDINEQKKEYIEIQYNKYLLKFSVYF